MGAARADVVPAGPMAQDGNIEPRNGVGVSDACGANNRPRGIPFSSVPEAQGLYDPRFESDSCGVAFVADLHGRASHQIVAHALTALHNLDHRGAAGAEPASGDGAGITVQVPDAFLRAVLDFDLPPVGEYAVGTAF